MDDSAAFLIEFIEMRKKKMKVHVTIGTSRTIQEILRQACVS